MKDDDSYGTGFRERMKISMAEPWSPTNRREAKPTFNWFERAILLVVVAFAVAVVAWQVALWTLHHV